MTRRPDQPTPRQSLRITTAALGVAAAAILLAGSDAAVAQTSRAADTGATSGDDLPSVRLQETFGGRTFTRPIWADEFPDGSGRFLVAEQRGRLLVFPDERSDEAEVFIDLRESTRFKHNEEGLLSVEFHPDFANNGEVFLYMSKSEPRRTTLSRFTVDSGDRNRLDPASEEVIIDIEQPYGNHNGGTALFGPDGMMYLAIGDGGWANDPHDHSQNLGTLLGTVIRIDVENTGADGGAYAIPADNPFVDRDDARPEIWAYGLRNIWRMSFDRETGELWAGDVGQNKWEEIDLVVKGGNYGWNLREGKHPFKSAQTETDSGVPLVEPVIDYPRDKGQSVTGGYVYRGAKMPGLAGAYIYADYQTGITWGLRYENGDVTAVREILVGPKTYVTSFGEDEAGELFVCGFNSLNGRGDRGAGKVYRLVE